MYSHRKLTIEYREVCNSGRVLVEMLPRGCLPPFSTPCPIEVVMHGPWVGLSTANVSTREQQKRHKSTKRASLVPRPRRGGEKAAWYLLHAHARSTPTKPGAPNTTVYFPHFPPVYVSKLLRVIQMIYAIASESTDWCVSYAPTDDPTRW